MEDTLRRTIQRVLTKMDQGAHDSLAERERMIQAVAEVQQATGQVVDPELIGQQVDAVLAEQAQEAQVAKEEAQAEQARKAARIPLHLWILGAILALPLLFPIARGLGVLIARLVRVAH